MAIKKSAHPSSLPGIHPGLQQKLREAEEAEKAGKTPRRYEKAQQVTRPAPFASQEERMAQIKALGLVESLERANADGLRVLAAQEAFLPGQDLDLIWDELSEKDKIRAGATERFGMEMSAVLEGSKQPHVPPHELVGRLDARSLGRIDENVEALVYSFHHLLAPDSQKQLLSFMKSSRDIVKLGQQTQKIRGVNTENLGEIFLDWTRKLIYQELASRQRGMGDRGIRRAFQNLVLTAPIYAYLREQAGFSPVQELLARTIAVHQDLGHTAYAARVSYRGTKMHRAYGARIFNDARNRLRALLKNEDIDIATQAVATHATPHFPYMTQLVLALVRASDHLVPFMPGRLSLHFKDHPSSHDYLQDMLDRGQNDDTDGYIQSKNALREHLGSLSIDSNLRTDMMASFRPVEKLAELYPLASFHGTISACEIDVQTPGALVCNLVPEPFSQRFGALFDEQQDLFLRLVQESEQSLKSISSMSQIILCPKESGAIVINRA